MDEPLHCAHVGRENRQEPVHGIVFAPKMPGQTRCYLIPIPLYPHHTTIDIPLYIYIVITTPWYTSFISHYTPINSTIHCNPMSKIPCGFLCHGRTPSSHPLILVFFRSVHEISYPAMIHHDPRQVTSITMQHEELAEAQIFRAQFTSRAGLSWASWQKHGIWVWPQGWNTLCILCVD